MVMPQLLIVTSTGPADPTRCSIAFHIAANGAGASGVDCGIVIAGDAAELMKPEVALSVRGVGIPPLADLLAACQARDIRLHI